MELETETKTGWPHESGMPTIKQRTAVQHAVARLLDALAPERAPARGSEVAAAVQRVRSPRGCILQSAARAVSVSWFPASSTDAAFGELQVIAWRGVVTRRGMPAGQGGGAVAEREQVLTPAEIAPDRWGWRTEGDATLFEGTALADYCLALLEG